MSLDLKSKFHQNNLNGVKPSGSIIYGFEDYRLDAGHLMLYHNGEAVSLTPKQVETLLALIEQRGEIVSKDVLMNRLWGDAAVEESNLIQNIYVLRKILGEARDGQPMIETLRRRGYRFNAEVTNHRHRTPAVSAAIRFAELESMLVPPDEPSDVQENVAAGDRSKKKLAAAIAGIALAALIVASYFVFFTRPVDTGVKTLAILPLKAIDSANRNIHYEIGVADSLINRLDPVKGLLVRSLSSVGKYNETEQDPVAAGREQKVDYVLASTYQMADGKIRITSKLINVATGEAEEPYRFEKEASSIFAVQDAVAADFADRLMKRFSSVPSGPAKGRGTENEEAYRHYQLAMSLIEQRSHPMALEHIDQAVALDSNFARAWAAKAYIHRYVGSASDPGAKGGHLQKSMEAVNKALAIDPNLSEAYGALCGSKNSYGYWAAGPEAVCKRAIDLDPDSSLAHKNYSSFLYTRGRFDESIAEIKRAMELQPVSYDNQQVYALVLFYARRYNESEAEWRRLISLNPNHALIYGFIANCLELQEKDSEAFEYRIKEMALRKELDDEKIERLRAVYATSGRNGITRERIKIAEAKTDPDPAVLARLYASIHEKDKAFEYLKKASQLAVLKVDPQLDPLRDDPRYADLVRRLEWK